MAQIIEQQDIFGRIGRNLGEGLSEQLPKEMDRSRLSSGLRKLGHDQLADVTALPGGSENIDKLYPLLLQSQQRQAFLKGQTPSENTQASSVAVPKDVVRENIKQSSPSRQPLAGSERIAASNEKILQPTTTEQRDSLAAKLINSGQVLDVGQARQMAQQQLDQDRSAQSEQLTKLQDDINKRIGLDLQGGGLADYKDVAGEIQRRLLDEARVRYLEGSTPEQVSQDISSILTDLGKVATKTKALGSLSNLGMSSKNKVSQLRQQKKDFEDYGFGEQFDDLAQAALGTTAMQTASILDPLNNKEFKKQADSFKSKLIGTSFGEKQLNRLVESITPEDNILSMAAYLRDNHIDVSKFLDRARQKEDLTEQQKRQLQKPASNSMLGDILFKVF